MKNHTRRFLVLGAVLVLALAAYITANMYKGFEPTSEAISAGGSKITPSAPVADPSPTGKPIKEPPTPTPTPKPTVGYITILPTPEPDAAPTLESQRVGKEWDPMERALMIDQNAQQIYVYENGRKLKTIPCSTGKPILDHFTPTWIGRVGELKGTIFSFGVYADNAWQLFKASGNILIHGAPYVYVDGEKVYQDLDSLGHYPSSHGCIRIHPADADWLTAWDITSVPIIVTPWQGGFSE